MATVVTTFSRRLRSFSRLRDGLSICLGILILSAWSSAQTAGASSCLPDEGVLFSCRLEGNHRMVSLCTAPKAAPFQSITYRYGSKAKSELTYVSSVENKNRFLATVSPVDPNASVRQIWFQVKDVKYIATACVGGNCPHRGGLIVFRGDKLLMSRACERDSSSHAWFSSEVVKFGSDFESSRSKTDLIQLQDYDNNVNVLYPWKRVN